MKTEQPKRTVIITAELTTAQALALAQFLKRVGYYTCEQLSDPTDKNEPYLMQEGLAVIRAALDEVGYSPR